MNLLEKISHKEIQSICNNEVFIPKSIRLDKKFCLLFLEYIKNNNIVIVNNDIYALCSWIGFNLNNYDKKDEYSEVKNITFAGKTKTYDLHIKNGNSYTANGIICHNTINLPKDTTVETIAEIYEAAWKAGLKGITVYRDGCRDGVLTDSADKCGTANSGKITKTDAPKRPKTLPCDIHHVSVKGIGYLVFVGLLDGEPYEVFAMKNGQIPKSVKKGELIKVKRGHYKASCENDHVIENIMDESGELEEAITRLVSSNLRHGADISFVVYQLEKTNTADQFGSFEKAIARSLKKYIPDGTRVSGKACSECGSDELERKEGCLICMSCGDSRCGG